MAALVAAFALAGCGRKGGLDPPPMAAAGEAGAAPALGPDGKPVAQPADKRKIPYLDWLID